MGTPKDNQLEGQPPSQTTAELIQLVTEARICQKLFAYFRRSLDSRWSDARCEELVSDTLLETWKSLPKYRGEASLSTFIFSIAKHLACQARRDAHWHEPLQSDDSLASCGEILPEEMHAVFELAKRVWAAVDALDDGHRASFLLHAVEGLPHSAAARRQGINEGAQRQNHHRAMAAINEALGQLCGSQSQISTEDVRSILALDSQPGDLLATLTSREEDKSNMKEAADIHTRGPAGGN